MTEFDWPPFRSTDNEPEMIIAAAAHSWCISPRMITGEGQGSAIVLPRRVAAWLMRELTEMTHSQIADALGWQHHSSSINAVQWVARRMNDDANLSSYLLMVSTRLAAQLESERF